MNAPWIKEEDVPAFAAWLDLFAEGQRALGYKAGLEAAVKVCRDEADSIDKAEVFLSRSHCLRIVAEAIASLPILGEEK